MTGVIILILSIIAVVAFILAFVALAGVIAILRRIPEIEYDKEDNCYVLKDCVRMDGGITYFNIEPFTTYANYNRKFEKEGKI